MTQLADAAVCGVPYAKNNLKVLFLAWCTPLELHQKWGLHMLIMPKSAC